MHHLVRYAVKRMSGILYLTTGTCLKQVRGLRDESSVEPYTE